MPLHLLHTTPDLTALTHWATRRQWLSPDGDFGYALHALLAEAFDGTAPTPFSYQQTQGLLAYTATDPTALQRQLAQAPADVRRILGLDQLRLRPFPDQWPNGKRLGFELRVRPIVRTNKGRERDLYLHRIEQYSEQSDTPKPTREVLYRDWLGERLAQHGAARLIDARLEGFKLTRVIRRSQRSADTQRKATGISGPDALFQGELEVADPLAFARLIAQGVGRHRAFGYGMLLLRPAGGV